MKILLISGTGVIGKALINQLLDQDVYVTSRTKNGTSGGITYLRGNIREKGFRLALLDNHKWDIVVDFSVYSTEEFKLILKDMNGHSFRYLFLSSYRVYGAGVDGYVDVASKRLLEVSEDKKFVSSEEYAIKKARQEDLLKNSSLKWVILRPTPIFGSGRLQLVNFELDLLASRYHNDGLLYLPKSAMNSYTTLTPDYDAIEIIKSVIHDRTLQKVIINVSSNVFFTWGELAEYIKEKLNIRIEYVSERKYLSFYLNRYQWYYDRKLDRKCVSNYAKLHKINLSTKLMVFDYWIDTLKVSEKRKVSGRINGRMDYLANENLWKCSHSRIYSFSYIVGRIPLFNCLVGELFIKRRWLK